MAYIALEGMRFHSFHGVYEAERILGTTYIVDVYVQTAQNNMAAATDDLSNALNYETVYMVCRSEMEKPRNLIEAVVSSILKRMKHQFATIRKSRVLSLEKLQSISMDTFFEPRGGKVLLTSGS